MTRAQKNNLRTSVHRDKTTPHNEVIAAQHDKNTSRQEYITRHNEETTKPNETTTTHNEEATQHNVVTATHNDDTTQNNDKKKHIRKLWLSINEAYQMTFQCTLSGSFASFENKFRVYSFLTLSQRRYNFIVRSHQTNLLD